MSSIAFELTAYSSSGTSSSTSSVEVNVVQGAVVARMVDYTDVINMSPRDQVTIDGSASYDSDSEYFYRKLYGSEVDSSMKEEMLFNLSLPGPASKNFLAIPPTATTACCSRTQVRVKRLGYLVYMRKMLWKALPVRLRWSSKIAFLLVIAR